MANSVKDPVCGLMVDPASARHERLAQNEYCFCSDECCNRFLVNPGRYLAR